MRHNNTDALSRRPCLPDGCRYCGRLETKEEELQERGEHFECFNECLSCQLAGCGTEGATKEELQERGGRFECLNECVSCQLVGYGTEGATLSKEELQISQEKDEDLGPMIRWMKESETRPPWEMASSYSGITKAYWSQWDSLQLVEGVLFRRWETPAGDRIIKQLVLPRDLQLQVMRQLHDAPTAGHLGVSKTLGHIRERFYWVQCSKDVKNYCKKCDLCASRRGPARKIKAHLSQYNVGAPME